MAPPVPLGQVLSILESCPPLSFHIIVVPLQALSSNSLISPSDFHDRPKFLFLFDFKAYLKGTMNQYLKYVP